MRSKGKAKKELSEKEIDRSVVAQANNDAAWGEPVHARKNKPASLFLPANLAPKTR
jgi:hypothetical protein